MTDPSAPWPPDLDPVTLALRHFVEASTELAGRMARLMAMNSTDMTAIAVLGLHGAMGATELAEHLGIRTASATVLIDRLERSGHVERVRDTADRRRVTVTPTPAAQQAERTAWAGVIEDLDAVCRSLTPTDRTVVTDLLTRLTDVTRASGRG